MIPSKAPEPVSSRRPHRRSPRRSHRPALRRLLAAGSAALVIAGVAATPADAVTTPQVIWTAGGASAGNDGVGNSSRMTVDTAGNVSVVSGPAGGSQLAVRSYTAAGALRWQSTLPALTGTYVGDWIVAAPNGDLVATGLMLSSSGQLARATIARFSPAGALLWRWDTSTTLMRVGRLVVDGAGNAYWGTNSQVRKYSPGGAVLWETTLPAGVSTSAALGPDGSDLVVTGTLVGDARWHTTSLSTATGAVRWTVSAAEGTAGTDLVVGADRVFVTGQGLVGTTATLSVIAYNRATGARLWRRDSSPGGQTGGQRIALAPDGSTLAAIGFTGSGGYVDWWTVSLTPDGTVRWTARRDAVASNDEWPQSVLVQANGTVVVTGSSGPVIRDVLGNSFLRGATLGYSSAGVLSWEALSQLPTAWAAQLPNRDVCATGGYDALTSCWRTSTIAPPPPPTPPSAPSGLTATALSISSIRLTWTNTTTAQTDVLIERCTGSGCTAFQQVAMVSGTATTYTDNGRASRTTYTYRVRAANASALSPYSNTAAARTLR